MAFKIIINLKRMCVLLCISGTQNSIGQRSLTPALLGSFLAEVDGRKIQIRVSAQSEASCGYEALYNGLEIRNIITSDLLNFANLSSVERRGALFGGLGGRWRRPIALARTMGLAKHTIEENLIHSFRGAPLFSQIQGQVQGVYTKSFSNGHRISFPLFGRDWRSEELDVLFPCLDNVARDVGTQRYTIEQTRLRYILPATEFRQKVKNKLYSRLIAAGCEMPGIYSSLSDDRQLEKYLEFKDIDCNVTLDQADWLEEGELRTIISSLPDNEQHNVFVMGGSIDVTAPLSQDNDVIGSDGFRALQAAFRTPGQDAIGVFVLYIREQGFLGGIFQGFKNLFKSEPRTEAEYSQDATESNTGGHWIAIVANKVGNYRQYVIADSLNNISRTRDQRVNELIQMLERDTRFEEAQNVSSVTAFQVAPGTPLVAAVNNNPLPQQQLLPNNGPRATLSSNVQTPHNAILLTNAKFLVSIVGVTSLIGYGIYRKYFYRNSQTNTEAQTNNYSDLFPNFLI